MEIENWSEGEVSALRVMAGSCPAELIGDLLIHSKRSVLAKIEELDLTGRPRSIKRYLTDAQITALENVQPGISAQKFAAMHGLGLGVVRYWALKLGVKFIPSPNWTDRDHAILRDAKDIETAMNLLGRSRRAVYDQARLIGVKLGGINHPGQTFAKMRAVPPAPKSAKKTPVRYRSLVWLCGTCHCPVSNWAQHYRRMPQCRIARVVG